MGVVGGSKFIIILSSTTLSFSFTISSTSFTTHSKVLNTFKSTITTRISFSSLSQRLQKHNGKYPAFSSIPVFLHIPNKLKKNHKPKFPRLVMCKCLLNCVFGFATLLLLSNCCFFPLFTHDPNSRPNRRKVKLCYIFGVVLIAFANVVALEDGMCAHE